MSEVAVRVEALGKKFTLGRARSVDLRRAVGQAVRSFFSNGTAVGQEFWALKDLNFEIRQGDVVGIIGRNGAGKSTLLKILSRITYPTTGRFEINGRVSSLLEVGTGFHFELTGRENIFLNGTILGMRRSEIKKKFDEIVAFSGIENFIDTSVKHYSSGMRVRLAFSVAAHLEPEILIIDEVLAVGDAEFQKKCLGKMDEVSRKEGRTVLFVSHNMAAVEGLCDSGLLLDNGAIQLNDKIGNVVKEYIGFGLNQTGKRLTQSTEGTEVVTFEEANFVVGGNVSSSQDGVAQLPFNCDLKICLRVNATLRFKGKLFVSITIYNENGVKVSTLDNLYLERPFYLSGSCLEISCAIKKFNLNPGGYYCSLWSSDGFETFQRIERALKFEVLPTNYLGTGRNHTAGKHGLVYFDQVWSSS